MDTWVCSFVFSYAAVKMLIDNCAAPPDHHRLDRSGGGGGGGRDAVSVVCVTTLRVPCEISCATTVASIGNDIDNNSPATNFVP